MHGEKGPDTGDALPEVPGQAVDLTAEGQIAYLQAENAALRRENAELRNQLYANRRTDPLTGLPDRQWFEEELERRASHASLAVGSLDLKDFKSINDYYGHMAGDWALQRCAHLILLSLREGDFVARLGGDEYGLLLDMRPRHEADLTSEERIAATTEQIQQRIAHYAGGKFDISIGIVMHEAGHDPHETWRLADRRMYEHKRRQQAQTDPEPQAQSLRLGADESF